MKFGEVATTNAEGCILAHSVKAGAVSLKKGHVLTGKNVSDLVQAGCKTVYTAELEPNDVPENEAAAILAEALCGQGAHITPAFTGRANIVATQAGLTLLDVDLIESLNRVHESITLATLQDATHANRGQLIATIKMIPFAVSKAHLDRALRVIKARKNGTVIAIRPYRKHSAALIQTTLPGLKPSLLTKGEQVVRRRLSALNIELTETLTCEHSEDAVSAALEAAHQSDLTLILGASATVDRQDVVPAGISKAGGNILHFGMPVDPGNLLLLAERSNKTVIGLPGCARSPKLNGTDWVLERIATGQRVLASDIQSMGVGGLLKEIPTRPRPREQMDAPSSKRRIAAIILAAGQSRRMGRTNKLTLPIGGKPMVAHVADAALASRVDEIILVTGHEPDKVEKALAGRPMTHVHNPDFAAGLSQSVRAGIEQAERSDTPIDAAIILLGDMPGVTAAMIDQIITAYDPLSDQMICVPTVNGKRGNPILWDASFFPDLTRLTGDVGAKHLIAENMEVVEEVPITDPAPLIDLDTTEAVAAYHQS